MSSKRNTSDSDAAEPSRATLSNADVCPGPTSGGEYLDDGSGPKLVKDSITKPSPHQGYVRKARELMKADLSLSFDEALARATPKAEA